MQSKFTQVLLSFVLVFTLAVYSGEAIKCYECIAVGSGTNECNGDIVAKSDDKNYVVDCDLSTMKAFESKLQSNPTMTDISNLFAVDTPKEHLSKTKMPMSCLKIHLKVGAENVLVRTCQTAPTEAVKPCQVMEEKAKKDYRSSASVLSCDICEGDKCNGSGTQSSALIVTFISVLGTLSMGLSYLMA
ncbi:uncharacterized protein LOC123264233 [Cotesia glomerata]|uniref:Protein sleepless n=1 Tax=Cotesia glomerata TaxID=32391 RepID=A0AAV7J5C1_COTGL|nr:uncharacterized protein LOC123264233 [Cotesia glomerata]KAH0567077.1 hypothetical protein KQX54_006484 [Cotesia glomerata]